jgi:hypothetical protein
MFKKLKKKTRRLIRNTVAAIHDRPLAPPSPKEQKLVEELRAAFAATSQDSAQGDGHARSEWVENAARLQELITSDDPRRFLRWDVVYKTMFSNQLDFIKPELRYLQNRPDWASRWSTLIQESRAGHPVPFWLYPRSSGNCIHHAYHWARFEEVTGLPVAEADFIFEFGGGYGSLCRLAYRLGFHGRYLIYDLPACSALQRFYLQLTDVNVLSPESFRSGQRGVLCISELALLKDIFSNEAGSRGGVFVATWSLSESPIELRHTICDLVRSFEGYLIAYQTRFADIDNVGFFQRWSAGRADVTWRDIEIEQMQGGSRYLMGRQRGSR